MADILAMGAAETADYKNFKLLCAYVNQARNYLLLLRKELGEVLTVTYTPINWFNRLNLTYTKDPAINGKDPILAGMKGVRRYLGGQVYFSRDWQKNTFSVLKDPTDTGCKTPQQTGGGVLDYLFAAVRIAESAAFVVDVMAFQQIDQLFNAYRWYLLEYMRRCGIQSTPCVRHDYILTTKLRTMGKLFRGRGAFQVLDDPIIDALRAARPSFPPLSYYLAEVNQIAKTKGGTRRRGPRKQRSRRAQ